ncbi:TMV resistance protein N-like isoform X2 [Punica granatum]|uniref:TMV resistance protein N-like isoform X2 n=1 Tax=Punica granatum TaxID=22663 RepID=A0A6P8BSJ8_PUNGR|nr:TMV resistance protein N-like isoform X2 [Punica granatum]
MTSPDAGGRGGKLELLACIALVIVLLKFFLADWLFYLLLLLGVIKLFKERPAPDLHEDRKPNPTHGPAEAMSESDRVSLPPGCKYEVFLSFRGPDTRQGFTDILYHALVDAGIHVFRDNEEIRKGEYIGDEILRAIEESGIFVPIFSRTYASSKWCLIELAKMVESKEKSSSSKKILPIFYDVGVDDVKLKTKLYTGALLIHRKKFSTDIVHQWEKALRDAGKIKGWELKDKGYAEFAKEFARKVSMELKAKQKYVTESLVERIDQQDALISLLDLKSSHDVRLVWIHGMGGIGKTTLAKVVFNRLCDHFDGCCFLLDVRETTERKGIDHLQRQLLQDLGVKAADISITDESDGIKIISKKLQNRKVLVVLDDVYDQEQIGKLAGEAGWFREGSRIIITSRNKNVPVFEGGRVEIFEAEPMKFEESLLLFSRHAFGKENPAEDFHGLSEEAVSITGGLPLALEVVGSKLRTSDRGHWNHIIGTLQKIPEKKVEDRLKICYDALRLEVKEIFLDIACFFINEKKTKAIYMWQACDFEPELAVQELVDASLVKLTNENKFWMHDQLRDLGRKLIRDERLKHHGKPCSRIWMHEDALKVLQDEAGRENVEMLSLFSWTSEDCVLTKHELKNFNNLRFLSLIRSKFSGDLEHVLPKLIWLSWHFCPGEFQGTNLHLKNLVVLDLSESSVSETWAGWRHIGMCKELKVLYLKRCYHLTKTPDLSMCTKLERLILKGCINLVEIDHSVGKLKCLKYLNASGCIHLREIPREVCCLDGLVDIVMIMEQSFNCSYKLPNSIGRLERLQRLSVSLGRSRPPSSLGDLKSLTMLVLSRSEMAELPESIGGLVKLEFLSLFFCKEITKLPNSIGGLKSLVELNISMSGIVQLPDVVGNLQKLKVIDMRGCDIRRLPDFLGNLEKLERLDVFDCKYLQVIPSAIKGLTSPLKVPSSAWEKSCESYWKQRLRLRRWRGAALTLNASRRFRYTLDLKEEEEKNRL